MRPVGEYGKYRGSVVIAEIESHYAAGLPVTVKDDKASRLVVGGDDYKRLSILIRELESLRDGHIETQHLKD